MSHDKITCQQCGAKTHTIQKHLKEDHEGGITLDDYKANYPDAPLLSARAKEVLKKGKSKGKTKSAPIEMPPGTKAFHEVFGFGKDDAARNAKGEPIPVTIPDCHPDFTDLIPEIDENHVFDISLLKDVMMGKELNIPVYLWGHMGTGKTSTHCQIAARTGRPWLRIQHTINTEESHILGQWVVRDGETRFEPGPLPVAMRYGLDFCADEYDRALPGVQAVYQPVLEGAPLVIKEADAENRMIKPHPNFRFTATGNTNGCGDETGLYQGTNIGDAANFERFGIMRRVDYMTAKQEVEILVGQAEIPPEDATVLVNFAGEIREAYDSGKIGMTISPRALIYAGDLGIRRGDYTVGLKLAFSNRLTTVDQEVADNIAQRLFG